MDTGEDTLTLAQVMAEINWTDRSALVRLLDLEETRTLLGVVPGPRPAYPRTSLTAFKALCEAQARGQVKPKTAPQWLRTYITGMPASEYSAMPSSEHSYRTTQAVPSAHDFTHIMASAIRETLADIVPVREDRLLTRAQAAEILACRPRSVGRYVRPVRRGTWRWSDVMAAIAAMGVRA